MKYFALLSFVVVSVVAGDGDNTLNTIPSDVSSGCGSFLKSLDSNSDLQACLGPIVKATSALSANASSSTVSSALASVCGSSTASACSDVLFRTTLSDFYTQCQSDLSSEGTVKALYDTLYTLSPFRAAVCQKDDKGASCLSSIVQGTTASLTSLVQNSTSKSTPPTPNAAYFAQTNIPFLFLLPSTTSSILCSDCAQNVMKAYTSFEIALPYGPGIKQSVLLSQQSALWDAMSKTCSASVVANAGAAPSGAAGGAGQLPGVAQGALSGAKSNAPGFMVGAFVAVLAVLAL